MTYRVLVTDEIDPDGLALLEAVPEFAVEEVPTLPLNELAEVIGNYDAFVGRSATKATAASAMTPKAIDSLAFIFRTSLVAGREFESSAAIR